jgi:protein-ribulosamine 3-kinase
MRFLIEAQRLSQLLGAEVKADSIRSVAGGDHRMAFRADSSLGPLFFKRGLARHGFAAEAAGLQALASARALRVPQVLAEGTLEATSYLVLEWIDFGAASSACEQRLGERLAQLHQVFAPSFGWHRDNTIGASAQPNGWHRDWQRFFAEQRLGWQLSLAHANGASNRLLERGNTLREALPGLFSGYEPRPSLLHGDLWGGNWGADRQGQPVIFDPAVYFGDREADVAMTRLFGGFGERFYAAYQQAWPLDAGAGVRTTLYNLYHVLNHFNLFGGAYQAQAVRMIDELLAQLGH